MNIITVCMSCKHVNMFHRIFMNIHYDAELMFIINCILKHIKIRWIEFYFIISDFFALQYMF